MRSILLAAAVGLVLAGAARAHAAEQWAIISGDGQSMLVSKRGLMPTPLQPEEWFESDAVEKLKREPSWHLRLFDSRDAAEQHIRAKYNGFTRAVEWRGGE